MQQLPLFIGLFFGLTTLATIFLFCKATPHFKATFLIITAWILFQMFIARTGFYAVTDALPPRLLVAIIPPFVFIAGLFATRAGRKYLTTLDVKWLTLLHIVRVPVELVLFWLYLHKAVPQVMTFEGRNWDILSGLTALLIFYFAYITDWVAQNRSF